MAFGDIFKTSEFKKDIASLKESISSLTQENNDLKNKADLKLSIHEMEPLKLDELIKQKKNTVLEVDAKIAEKNKSLEEISKKIAESTDSLNNIRADINDLTPDLEMSSYGLYRPQYDFSTSLGYKDMLKTIRDDQKSMIKNKTAVSFNPNWLVNNSKTEGRKMNRNNIKAILRSFNNECTEAIGKTTYSNYDRIVKRIKRSFDQHNKMYRVVDIQLNYAYLDLKIKELNVAFEYRQKVEDEKETLREEREKEREEKALQREIAAKRKQATKEIKHYSQAISELKEKYSANPQDESLKDEIAKLQEELSKYHEQEDEVDYREQHATAGYVYIISNIGSFGKNVFKIGVTRRLEPMDRINELSSASVPFKFDVHALIFSEDAYKLEAELHNRFTNRRINKVNNRKEYFSISIEDVENELKKYKNVTVDFKERPEADEYRETLALENNS